MADDEGASAGEGESPEKGARWKRARRSNTKKGDTKVTATPPDDEAAARSGDQPPAAGGSSQSAIFSSLFYKGPDRATSSGEAASARRHSMGVVVEVPAASEPARVPPFVSAKKMRQKSSTGVADSRKHAREEADEMGGPTTAMRAASDHANVGDSDSDADSAAEAAALLAGQAATGWRRGGAAAAAAADEEEAEDSEEDEVVVMYPPNWHRDGTGSGGTKVAGFRASERVEADGTRVRRVAREEAMADLKEGAPQPDGLRDMPKGSADVARDVLSEHHLGYGILCSLQAKDNTT